MMYLNLKKIALAFAITFSIHPLLAANLIQTAQGLFTKKEDEREEHLNHLKDELKKLHDKTNDELQKLKDTINQTSREINEIKEKKASGQQKDFLAKKTSLLNEIYQTALDVQFWEKEILSIAEQNIKMLDEYTKDPFFKNLALEPRSFYNFDQIQNGIKKVFDQETKIKLLNTQKDDSIVEHENRKKKLVLAKKERTDKKKEQEVFASKSNESQEKDEFSFAQQGEILDLEEKHLSLEEQLADLKVQAATRSIALVNTTFSIEKEKIQILKNNLNRIRSGLRIATSDVQLAHDALEKRKHESLSIKDKQYEEIKVLSAVKEQYKRDFEILKKKYKVAIPETEELSSWSIEIPTLDGYSALCELGLKSVQIDFINRKIEYLRAEILFEETKLSKEELEFSVLETWYDLTQNKFKDNEDIILIEKKFKEKQNETQRDLNLITDKRNSLTNLLNTQNKELADLNGLITKIKKEKNGIFSKNPARLNTCLTELAECEKMISERIDISGKLIEVYSQLIGVFTEIAKQTNVILSELETKNIWQRSEYAISWEGVKNTIPDIGYFIHDVHQASITYINSITWNKTTSTLNKIIRSPGSIILILLLISFAIGFYFFLNALFAAAIAQLTAAEPKNKISFIGTNFCLSLFTFLKNHLFLIYPWLILFALFHTELIHDLFPRIIFNLISMPYLIYCSYLYINYLISYNRKKEYPIFAKVFEQRFQIVFSLFAYLTIFVLFFRESFILITVHKSELPIILLAGYSIILRALIIFSIGKDEILSIIENQGTFWDWLAALVEKYYYLMLTTIIVLMIMSDPYVGGFGNLVSYILWGTIGSAILIQVIFFVQNSIKKHGEIIFFSTDDEMKKERFGYAKTWYGIFVIALFVMCLFVGIVIGTHIWGIPIEIQDLHSILHFQIFNTGLDKATGQFIWFTPMKLISIITIIIGGFVIALAFNRFVLQRIFDILPVDIGVQNTVFSLTRYVIIIIVIYVAFLWSGLGNLLLAIFIALGSIAYIVKEPVGDFISYFIILVQRPVQIGDYVMIDAETQGVVRKITPRALILRRKDSYSIIVPNSMLLSRPLNNWSYARNFIAIDDITFSIPYDADPVNVKKIIIDALDENMDVLKSPRPVVRLNEFGQDGYVFMVRGFISNINILRRWEIASDIRFNVIAALAKEGLGIAVPTRKIISK